MKLHIKRTLRWIWALESGEYVQGRDRLKNNDLSMCCLGVACDVSIRQGQWTTKPSYNNQAQPYFVTKNGETEATSLPVSLARYYGINADREAALIGLNDIHYSSFRDIAARLRTWLREDHPDLVLPAPAYQKEDNV